MTELKTHEQIVKEKMAEIKKDGITDPLVQKETAEPSEVKVPDSSTEPKPKEEKTVENQEDKPEEKSDKPDAEKHAEEVEAILKKDDADLTKEELATKIEHLKGKQQEDKQSKLDKRFAKITGELKDLRKDKESNKELIDRLQREKDDLEKRVNKSEPTEAEVLDDMRAKRIESLIEQDKELPREQRREMAKEDLTEWYLDDPTGATEWLIERDGNRRGADRLETLRVRQGISFTKVMQLHPELNVTDRRNELSSEGKSKEAIEKILCEENEKYKITQELMKKNLKEFIYDPKGPEKLMKEMEKTLAEKPVPKSEEDEEKQKLQAEVDRLQSELSRQQSIDELPTSKLPGKTPGLKSEQDKKVELDYAVISKKSGIPIETIKKRISERKKIPGLG